MRERERKTQTLLFPQALWPLPNESKRQLCAVKRGQIPTEPCDLWVIHWPAGLACARSAMFTQQLVDAAWSGCGITDHQEGFRLRRGGLLPLSGRAVGCRDNQLHTPLMQKTTRPIGYAATGVLKLLTRSISSCPISILIEVNYSRVNIHSGWFWSLQTAENISLFCSSRRSQLVACCVRLL